MKKIHYSLLFFNLLPIYPLDGGRILHAFSCYFLSYYKSYTFLFFFSYCFLFLLFLLFFFSPDLSFFLLLFIIVSRIICEKKNIKYYKERFLLERYLKKYTFKKRKIVKGEEEFLRNYTHIVKTNKWYQTEQDYLKEKYQR